MELQNRGARAPARQTDNQGAYAYRSPNGDITCSRPLACLVSFSGIGQLPHPSSDMLTQAASVGRFAEAAGVSTPCTSFVRTATIPSKS